MQFFGAYVVCMILNISVYVRVFHVCVVVRVKLLVPVRFRRKTYDPLCRGSNTMAHPFDRIFTANILVQIFSLCTDSSVQ